MRMNSTGLNGALLGELFMGSPWKLFGQAVKIGLEQPVLDDAVFFELALGVVAGEFRRDPAARI
jgi:hypothetical protein